MERLIKHPDEVPQLHPTTKDIVVTDPTTMSTKELTQAVLNASSGVDGENQGGTK